MEKLGVSIPLQLSQTPTSNNPEVWTALAPVHNAIYQLAFALDQYTGFQSDVPDVWDQLGALRIYSGNMGKLYLPVGARIEYGAMVTFGTILGILNAVPARANSINTVCRGFCNHPGGFNIGDTGEFIIVQGLCAGLSGLVAGKQYWLDPNTTTGQVTPTIPNIAGQVRQQVGWAINSTTLMVHPDQSYAVI
jgi:hypothetical protein